MHASQASFDVAVVGFDAIVRVASGLMSTAVTEMTFPLHFSNGCRITSQSVSNEHAWYAVVGISQGSLQEALRGFPITSFG